VPLGTSGGQRQQRIESVQYLDRGFLVHQNTAACCGGFMYRPMMSAAFCSNCGSLLAM
jgi:hypothetical protein